MSIVTKLKDTAADGPAPAGTLKLVANAATGTYVAVDASGAVLPLGGEGLPAGGTPGQVVTKIEGGAAWDDAPAGGAPSGTWTDMLPPNGACSTEDGAPRIVVAEASSARFELSLDVGTKYSTRVRGTATVILDVIKEESVSPGAGEYRLEIGYSDADGAPQSFGITPGSNAVSFDFEVSPDHSSPIVVPFLVNRIDATNVYSEWVDCEVTQCDLLLHDAGTVTTSAFTMTPLAVTGQNNGGSGGGHIAKAGTLASATTIEIVGYYPSDVTGLGGAAATNFYAPRWINEDDYVAVEPAAAIPVFGAEPPAGSEGDWGWIGGDAFDTTIPADQWSICKVKIDGGAPVFALLSNMAGF